MNVPEVIALVCAIACVGCLVMCWISMQTVVEFSKEAEGFLKQAQEIREQGSEIVEGSREAVKAWREVQGGS